MKPTATFRTILLLMTMIVIIFSCSDNDDPMESTLKNIGEPDDKIVENFGTFKTELWIYARCDYNFVYRFEKSNSSCGGSSEWLLSPYRSYADYHYGYSLYNPPPTIIHTPAISSESSEPVVIKAQVKLHEPVGNFPPDEGIIEVNLAYRAHGDSLFEKVLMSVDDSLFVESVPSTIVSAPGFDYYIEATSDRSPWHKYSQIPEDGYYTVAVSDSVSGAIYADEPDIWKPKNLGKIAVDPEKQSGQYSPISP